jgi:hypothetical protein
MGIVRVRRFGRPVLVGFAGVLAVLALPSPAGAHDSTWVYQSEAGQISTQANENINSYPDKTNLCEDWVGIPFGYDPSWVRVSGSPDPNTPFVEASGQLLPDLNGSTNPYVTGGDDPFTHYSKDLNAFLTLDPSDRYLLADGNFLEGGESDHAMLEVEWERWGVPLYAYPAAGDRMTVWGTHSWDCGHGMPDQFRTEIHPPVGWVLFRNLASTGDRDVPPPDGKRTQDPWVWYEVTDRQGIGATLPKTPLMHTPVQATVADVFLSSFGGNAVESLDGCADEDTGSNQANAPCLPTFPNSQDWFQPVLNQDYSFFVPAPPKPDPSAQMVWESENRCSQVPPSPGNPPGTDIEDIGEADDTAANIGTATCSIPAIVIQTTENGQLGIRVTVKAKSSGVGYPANHYLAFARRYKVAWNYVPASEQRARVYQVGFGHLRVYDDSEPCGNDGEWVISIRVNEAWIHPVRGRGDNGRPFWTDGAIDDAKCFDPAQYVQYAIGGSLRVSVVPGQPLNVWERSYDKDPFWGSDVNPVVNAFPPGPGTYEDGTPDESIGGAHTIGYTVTDITPQAPLTGLLRPSVLRVVGSTGHWLQYRYRGPGAAAPSAWLVDRSGRMMVRLPGSSGRYVVDYAAASRAGVLGERRTAVFDLTPGSGWTPRRL